MKLIPLSQGKFAKVSDHQFERIVQFSTFHYAKGYAKCIVKTDQGHVTIPMQNLIKPPPDGMEVDHIDGDGLNNQDENLRFATRGQQMQNAGLRSNNKTGVKGVCWNKRNNRWRPYIMVNKKQIYLGSFVSFEGAAAARKRAEELYFGEFACRNPERPQVTKRHISLSA